MEEFGNLGQKVLEGSKKRLIGYSGRSLEDSNDKKTVNGGSLRQGCCKREQQMREKPFVWCFDQESVFILPVV